MYSIFYFTQIVLLIASICTLILFSKDNNKLYKINSACLVVCSSMFFLLEYIVRNVTKGYITDDLAQIFYFVEKPKNSYTFILWILNILCFMYITYHKSYRNDKKLKNNQKKIKNKNKKRKSIEP